ncbi:MAG: response regulator, partial [Acidobacteriaceae bacterium]
MTAAIAASPVFPQPLTSSGLLNLLIVEEDRTLREMSREVASSLGYRATSAESIDQALRMLDGQDIDVVLLDFKLHGLTGVQALRQIRAMRSELEVVVVTSSSSIEVAVEAM